MDQMRTTVEIDNGWQRPPDPLLAERLKAARAQRLAAMNAARALWSEPLNPRNSARLRDRLAQAACVFRAWDEAEDIIRCITCGVPVVDHEPPDGGAAPAQMMAA